MHRNSMGGRLWSIAALALLVVAVLNGCGKKEASSTDTGVATDTVPGGGLVAQSKEGYPTDGKNEDWLEYVTRRLDFNVAFEDIDSTAIVTYPCKAGDSCPGNVARFLVIAEKHAFQVDWKDALKIDNAKKGFVTAVYWNMDRIAVPSLSLPANASLYQWVGAVSPTEYGIQLFSVTSATPVAIAASGSANDYNFCKFNSSNRTKSAAKLKPTHACENAAPSRSGSAQSTPYTRLAKNTMMVVERFPEDLWLSCAGGCCESSLTSIL